MKTGRPFKGTTLTTRLLSSIRINENGCWIWQGSKRKAGKFKGHKVLDYGRVKIGTKTVPAHRASWIAFRGPIPTGKRVCHECDVPPCINPDHLFIGTTAKNNRDCKQKGRHSHGEKHPKSKLTDEIVRKIRKSYKAWDRKHSMNSLARRFKMSCSMISNVINRRRWAHVK
jgi:HNH endonuclease